MALPKYLENLAEQSQYVQKKHIEKFLTAKIHQHTLTDQDVMDVCDLFGYDYAIKGEEVRKQLEEKHNAYLAGKIMEVCALLGYDYNEKKDYVKKMILKGDKDFSRKVKECRYWKMKEEDAILTRQEEHQIKELDASTGNPLIEPGTGMVHYRDLEHRIETWCDSTGQNYVDPTLKKKQKIWKERSIRRAEIARLEKELGIDPRKDQISSSDNGSPGTTNALF